MGYVYRNGVEYIIPKYAEDRQREFEFAKPRKFGCLSRGKKKK